ncbi:MAG: Plug and carboxypeptidase regulatory-like domain-containing protein [Acidobacteria bacterium]|nr:Plug and carboxypeptidase regulatory-like domain-containing protein [Acidobacteriota bacterium]
MKMKRRGGLLVAGAALGATLVLWLASGGSLEAQTTSASVSGVVGDVQGGRLSEATVTLTSRTQGYSLTTTTDEQGRFVFPIVRPDRYALQASMSGFRTLEQSNVVVSANDDFSAGILTLEIGEMSESVSVFARVAELQTESGERSFALEGEVIENIANDGRSLFGFVKLVPGVAPVNENENPIDAYGFSVNGQRRSQNNVTIDGVANIDTGNNGGPMATTNLDAVAEFKVLTNAYQAEYGRAVGGQVQMVTKSGTQEFHGSGYWYGRRSGWDANSWTNKRGPGPAIEPPEASRNDYGYTIGGPVFIPGVFNKDRTKVFFFWSQEFQRRKDPVAERQGRVPTALERQGDFSESVDSSGNPWPYIRDYTTGRPCGPGDTRGCFQDGGVLGRIPQDRLYPPGINALDIYPMPNFAGASGINYRSQTPDDQPRREELLRIDVQATGNWRFTGRYMRSKDLQKLAYGWLGGSNVLDDSATTFDRPGRNWMLSATGILDPATSLEISVGSAHNAIDVEMGKPTLRRSAAGLTDLPLLYPDAVQQDYIPTLFYSAGRVGPSAAYYLTGYMPFVNENTTYDVVANLTRVWGSHTGKFGVYYQSSSKPQSAVAPFNSFIVFVDDPSNPFGTGFGYANAATGVFTQYGQASASPYPEWVYKNFEWYAQDNWKATSRLTLDYGVRFYYLTPQWDQTLQASNFLPDRFDFQNAATLYSPVCIGASPCSGGARRGMDPALISAGITPTPENTVDGRFIGRLVPGSNRFNGAFQAGQGINDTMQSGSAFRVSPRFGFVYDLSGRLTTILRGGFGIFYDRPWGNMVFDQINNPPGLLQPLLQWGRLQDLGAAAGDPDPTLAMYPTVYDFAPPKVYAWNLGLQQKLSRSIVLDVAYVGSSSKDLLSGEWINAVPYGAKFLPENQDPTRPPSPIAGASALPDDFLRPYPGYGDIGLTDYRGYSNYHSLQTSLHRRFDNGLMFSAFYVWSKALGVNDGDWASVRPAASDEEVRRADYSYVAHDRPHTFVVDFVYQTPRVADGLLGVLANDWQISGIYRWMSGTPYPINFFIPGIGPANLTGSDFRQNARVVVTCDPGSGSSGDPYRQVDTSCFAPPQTPSDGTESARYFVHGPGVDNLDLSISKAFTLRTRLRFEVRVDMFNALNHTQFSGVNNTVVFASQSDPTILNLPHDADGNLVRYNGFGSIDGVRPPRRIQLVTRLTF